MDGAQTLVPEIEIKPGAKPSLEGVDGRRMMELGAIAAVGLPALLYATGFIVVSGAEDRLGIASAVAESFRARYIQAGFFCVAFVGLFGVLGYLVRQMEHCGPERTAAGRSMKHMTLSWKIILVVFPVLMGLYIQQTIGTPYTIFGPLMPTLLDVPLPSWLFLAYVGGMIAIAGLLRAKESPQESERLIRRSLVILASAGVLYFASTLASIRFHGWLALWRLGFYTFLMGATAWFMGRIVHALTHSKTIWFEKDRRALAGLCVGLIVFLYYMLASAYAAFWFPFISVRKGGCDFSTAPECRLQLVEEMADALPEAMVREVGLDGSTPVVVLLQTVDAYYVAQDWEGRALWGKLRHSHPLVIHRIEKAAVKVLKLDNSEHQALSSS